MTTTNTATEAPSSIKTLTAASLSPVALIYKAGEDIDDETGAIRPDYQYAIFDQAAFDATHIPSRTYCDCCGQPLKYACVFKHTSGRTYFVGRDCAATIEGLKASFVAGLDKLSISLALRAQCNAREVAFLNANPAAEEAYVWAKASTHRIAKDLADKIRSYGNPSEKQVALLVKIHREETERRANITGTVPTGRTRVTGTIVSVKVEYSEIYSSWSCKLVVDLGGGIRVWGNGGSACIDADAKAIVERGDTIAFDAAFTTSDRDPSFGFFKRPTKVTITKQKRMNRKHEIAQAKLESLRTSRRALRIKIAEINKTIVMLESESRRVERAAGFDQCPVYHTDGKGLKRRVVWMTAHYVTLRWDGAHPIEYRLSDGREKCTRRFVTREGAMIDLDRARRLWDEHCAHQTAQLVIAGKMKHHTALEVLA